MSAYHTLHCHSSRWVVIQLEAPVRRNPLAMARRIVYAACKGESLGAGGGALQNYVVDSSHLQRCALASEVDS